MTDAHLTEALRLIQQARRDLPDTAAGEPDRHVWKQLGRAASHIEIAREALGEENDAQ